MIRIEGTWYDGVTSNSTPAVLEVYDSGSWRVFSADEVIYQDDTFWPTVSPRLGNTPRHISFSGDESFETSDNAGVDGALRLVNQGFWAAKLHLLESRSRYVLVAVVLFCLLGFVGVRYGVPAAADIIAQGIPHSMIATAGKQTMKVFDKTFFSPSELDVEREKQLRTYLKVALDDHPGLKLEILFRKGGAIGANAFALPNGQIVITDEMVALAEKDEELLAIVFHEIGHIVHKHGMRRLIQNSILSFAILAVTGDASGVSELFLGLPVLLTELGYSRGFEIEADQYALQYLNEHAIDPAHFGNILKRVTRLDDERESADNSGVRWYSYFSTHPATEERIRFIRQAGR